MVKRQIDHWLSMPTDQTGHISFGGWQDMLLSSALKRTKMQYHLCAFDGEHFKAKAFKEKLKADIFSKGKHPGSWGSFKFEVKNNFGRVISYHMVFKDEDTLAMFKMLWKDDYPSFVVEEIAFLY